MECNDVGMCYVLSAASHLCYLVIFFMLQFNFIQCTVLVMSSIDTSIIVIHLL